MVINFVGNFQRGYVGEEADEVHLSRELERLGNTVRRIPRDAWREYVIESFPKGKYDVPEKLEADINIICKWHHFYDGRFIKSLKKKSNAPVFYWVWDYMWDQGFPDWHILMAREADLYLSNEGGLFDYYVGEKVTPYYFPMDVCDGDLPVYENEEKKYDVVFPGSYLKQGDRVPMLKAINKEIPVKIFAWNYEEWRNEGFDSSPAVYGADFNKMIAQSRVVLGFNVNAHCWGYWSNRVGKVFRAGGNLFYQYAPGMELHGVPTFVDAKSCLAGLEEARNKPKVDASFREYWTSKTRCNQLYHLMLMYLQEGKLWNKLP